ncbi:MAG TPA: hypothetical protein VKX49_31375 [Bryobacteraceae bacterium]|nr:hypothetical protein [Bryobacteraceae bacterium]
MRVLILLQAQMQMPSVPGPPPLPPLPEGMSYADATVWLGVMVACATLVVAMVGVLIAVLAFFGYGFFKEELPKRADAAAVAAAEEYFKGKAFEDKLEDKLKESAVIKGPFKYAETLGKSGIDEKGSVAERYPKASDTSSEGGTS